MTKGLEKVNLHSNPKERQCQKCSNYQTIAFISYASKVVGLPCVGQTVKSLPAMQETWVWYPGQEDPLEKGIAILFSILAWKIPWTEESDGLQFMELQRVGHKVMLKILQTRFQQDMNQEFPDVQAGFRKGRGTRDQIANICWIIEKAREFQKNIYFCFIDYAKASDCVDHSKLWTIIKDMRIPDLRNLYAGQEATTHLSR